MQESNTINVMHLQNPKYTYGIYCRGNGGGAYEIINMHNEKSHYSGKGLAAGYGPMEITKLPEDGAGNFDE